MSKKNTVLYYLKRYFVEAMGATAMGLFASLIIGTIFKQVLALLPQNIVGSFAEAINSQLSASSPVIGAAIGTAIAYVLKSKPLAIYSSAVAGAIGYVVSAGTVVAGPVGAFAAAVVAAEIGSLVSGKTPFDILLVPIASISSGTIISLLIGPPVANFMLFMGQIINEMTLLRPFLMGISVSLTMSLLLLSPLSSAAVAIMLNLSGLAAGAATAGCSASMVGFAVASYSENKFGGLVAQGIGTSMLQFGNCMAHPSILLPASVAAVIVGPLSTMLFKMTNVAGGAGMGTSGLVGQITAWASMKEIYPTWYVAISILVVHILVPAVIAALVSYYLRKKNIIKYGYMKIQGV